MVPVIRPAITDHRARAVCRALCGLCDNGSTNSGGYLTGRSPSAEYSRTAENVVLYVRLPRILIAGLAGAGLAVAGAALQGIFRNPLVGPQIIGVSSGAALGGALALLLFSSLFITISFAFLGGLLAIVLVFLLGLNRHGSSLLMLILAGVIINAFFAALISLITYFADRIIPCKPSCSG